MRESDTAIELTVPGEGQLLVNMETVYRAEARIQDIAFVNRETAGELLSMLNQGYSELSRAFGRVCYAVSKLEKSRKHRKAVLTLDIIPEKAKEKGLANSRSPTGSEDVREAFYYTDKEFLDLTDALGAAEATKELLGIKLRSLWAAMDAVKSITREQRPGLPSVGVNHTETEHSLDAPMLGPTERSPSPFKQTIDALEVRPIPAADLCPDPECPIGKEVGNHKPHARIVGRKVVVEEPTPTSKPSRWAKPKYE